MYLVLASYEQTRRLGLPDHCVEHSLGRFVRHAVKADVVCQVRVHLVKSRTARALSIAQEEPPFFITQVRE